MPNMANLIVKKNDGTTDVTYVAKAPAGGDGVAAIWRNESQGTAPAHFPELRLTSRDLKRGVVRNLRSTMVYPQVATNTTTGVTSVVDKAFISTNWDFPRGMPQTEIDQVVSQYANLLVSTLVKDSIKAGFAPT